MTLTHGYAGSSPARWRHGTAAVATESQELAKAVRAADRLEIVLSARRRAARGTVPARAHVRRPRTGRTRPRCARKRRSCLPGQFHLSSLAAGTWPLPSPSRSSRMEKDGVSGPFMFQWSDNYVKNTAPLEQRHRVRPGAGRARSRRAWCSSARSRVTRARTWAGSSSASKLGEHAGMPYYGFRSWQYRPPKARCEDMLASGNFVWNSGYFVTTVEFMTSAFRKLAPELAERIEEIVSYRGTPRGRGQARGALSQGAVRAFRRGHPGAATA